MLGLRDPLGFQQTAQIVHSLRGDATCFPLLFAALTGRSGLGLADVVDVPPHFAADPLGL